MARGKSGRVIGIDFGGTTGLAAAVNSRIDVFGTESGKFHDGPINLVGELLQGQTTLSGELLEDQTVLEAQMMYQTSLYDGKDSLTQLQQFLDKIQQQAETMVICHENLEKRMEDIVDGIV